MFIIRLRVELEDMARAWYQTRYGEKGTNKAFRALFESMIEQQLQELQTMHDDEQARRCPPTFDIQKLTNLTHALIRQRAIWNGPAKSLVLMDDGSPTDTEIGSTPEKADRWIYDHWDSVFPPERELNLRDDLGNPDPQNDDQVDDEPETDQPTAAETSGIAQ